MSKSRPPLDPYKEEFDRLIYSNSKVEGWIVGHTELWTYPRMYASWLGMDTDLRHTERRRKLKPYKDNVNILLSKELEDKIGPSALTHFFDREDLTLRAFSMNSTLQELLIECEQRGLVIQTDLIKASYGPTVNGTPPKSNGNSPRADGSPSGKSAAAPHISSVEEMLMWSQMCGVERLKELWFNPAKKEGIERLGGCTAILEQCLYDVQLMTPDPRLHNLIHSTCPLFGPICTGLVAVEEAQMNMLVVLKKQLSLGKVSGIAILLEQRLQSLMKEAGNSKLSVLVDTERTKCAIKVFFRHGTEILCTINVLFTFTEIFKEMKRKSRAVYLSEMHPAGYSNALHVVREVFLLGAVGSYPDLHLGTIMMMDIWRRSDDLRSIVSRWDLLVILWTMSAVEAFTDPSILIQRFYAAWTGGLFRKETSADSSCGESRSFNGIFGLAIDKKSTGAGEVFSPHGADPLALNPDFDIPFRSKKGARSTSDLQKVDLQVFGKMPLEMIIKGRMHKVLSLQMVSENMKQMKDLLEHNCINFRSSHEVTSSSPKKSTLLVERLLSLTSGISSITQKEAAESGLPLPVVVQMKEGAKPDNPVPSTEVLSLTRVLGNEARPQVPVLLKEAVTSDHQEIRNSIVPPHVAAAASGEAAPTPERVVSVPENSVSVPENSVAASKKISSAPEKSAPGLPSISRNANVVNQAPSASVTGMSAATSPMASAHSSDAQPSRTTVENSAQARVPRSSITPIVAPGLDPSLSPQLPIETTVLYRPRCETISPNSHMEPTEARFSPMVSPTEEFMFAPTVIPSQRYTCFPPGPPPFNYPGMYHPMVSVQYHFPPPFAYPPPPDGSFMQQNFHGAYSGIPVEPHFNPAFLAAGPKSPFEGFQIPEIFHQHVHERNLAEQGMYAEPLAGNVVDNAEGRSEQSDSKKERRRQVVVKRRRDEAVKEIIMKRKRQSPAGRSKDSSVEKRKKKDDKRDEKTSERRSRKCPEKIHDKTDGNTVESKLIVEMPAKHADKMVADRQAVTRASEVKSVVVVQKPEFDPSKSFFQNAMREKLKERKAKEAEAKAEAAKREAEMKAEWEKLKEKAEPLAEDKAEAVERKAENVGVPRTEFSEECGVLPPKSESNEGKTEERKPETSPEPPGKPCSAAKEERLETADRKRRLSSPGSPGRRRKLHSRPHVDTKREQNPIKKGDGGGTRSRPRPPPEAAAEKKPSLSSKTENLSLLVQNEMVKLIETESGKDNWKRAFPPLKKTGKDAEDGECSSSGSEETPTRKNYEGFPAVIRHGVVKELTNKTSYEYAKRSRSKSASDSKDGSVAPEMLLIRELNRLTSESELVRYLSFYGHIRYLRLIPKMEYANTQEAHLQYNDADGARHLREAPPHVVNGRELLVETLKKTSSKGLRQPDYTKRFQLAIHKLHRCLDDPESLFRFLRDRWEKLTLDDVLVQRISWPDDYSSVYAGTTTLSALISFKVYHDAETALLDRWIKYQGDKYELCRAPSSMLLRVGNKDEPLDF